jgi:hypothetical protein
MFCDGSGVTRHKAGYWLLTRKPYRNKYLHRVFFEKALGRSLGPEYEIEHSCHDTTCLIPEHWILMSTPLHRSTSATNSNIKRCARKRNLFEQGRIPESQLSTHAQAAEFAKRVIYQNIP